MKGASRVTAYHEAGHAVADLLCGHSVYGIQAGPYYGSLLDRRGRVVRCAGLTESTAIPNPPHHVDAFLKMNPAGRPELIRRAFEIVMSTGAGPAAEARFGHKSWVACAYGDAMRGDGDFDYARQAMYALFRCPKRRDRAIWRTWEVSRRFVNHPKVWGAISSVAESLIAAGGRLDGSQIEDCLTAEGINIPPFRQRNLAASADRCFPWGSGKAFALTTSVIHDRRAEKWRFRAHR